MRDPRVDPEPGDRIHVGRETYEVLKILTLPDDCEPELGVPPHVEVRNDRPSGLRRETMSIKTWRTMCTEVDLRPLNVAKLAAYGSQS